MIKAVILVLASLTKRIRMIRTFVSAVLAVLVVMPAAFAADVAGEWWGEWSAKSISGKIFLTVTKVGGSTVSGEVESIPSKIGREKFDDGHLEGDTLTIKTPSREIVVRFDGNTMEGEVKVSNFVTTFRGVRK